MKLYTENFKINRNTKFTSSIETRDELLDALKELVLDLDDEKFQEYKNLDKSKRISIFNGYYKDLINNLFGHNKEFAEDLALNDLVSILILDNKLEKNSDIYHKYCNNLRFVNELKVDLKEFINKNMNKINI